MLKFLWTGNLCKVPYGSGFIAGFFSQDNFGVGDQIVTDQVFAEALTEKSIDLIFNKFDGILGLGFQDTSIGEADPIWYFFFLFHFCHLG